MKDVNNQLADWQKHGKRIALAIAAGLRSENVALENALKSLIRRMFPAVFKAGNKPAKAAMGMVTPGTGTGDTVHAMLTPGELVLNQKHQRGLKKKLGVSGGPHALFGRIQQFAEGGVVAMHHERGEPASFNDLSTSDKRRRIVYAFNQGRMSEKQAGAAWKFWQLGPGDPTRVFQPIRNFHQPVPQRQQGSVMGLLNALDTLVGTPGLGIGIKPSEMYPKLQKLRRDIRDDRHPAAQRNAFMTLGMISGQTGGGGAATSRALKEAINTPIDHSKAYKEFNRFVATLDNPKEAQETLLMLEDAYEKHTIPVTKVLRSRLAAAGIHNARISSMFHEEDIGSIIDQLTRDIMSTKEADKFNLGSWAPSFRVSIGTGDMAPDFSVFTGRGGRFIVDDLIDPTDTEFFSDPSKYAHYAKALAAIRGNKKISGFIELFRAMSEKEYVAWRGGEKIPAGKYFTKERTTQKAQDIAGHFPNLYKFKVSAEDVTELTGGDYVLHRDAFLGVQNTISSPEFEAKRLTAGAAAQQAARLKPVVRGGLYKLGGGSHFGGGRIPALYYNGALLVGGEGQIHSDVAIAALKRFKFPDFGYKTQRWGLLNNAKQVEYYDSLPSYNLPAHWKLPQGMHPTDDVVKLLQSYKDAPVYDVNNKAVPKNFAKLLSSGNLINVFRGARREGMPKPTGGPQSWGKGIYTTTDNALASSYSTFWRQRADSAPQVQMFRVDASKLLSHETQLREGMPAIINRIRKVLSFNEKSVVHINDAKDIMGLHDSLSRSGNRLTNRGLANWEMGQDFANDVLARAGYTGFSPWSTWGRGNEIVMFDNKDLFRRFAQGGIATKLAEGGIVTRPTHALIGERGPEAVIPLNKRTSITNTHRATRTWRDCALPHHIYCIRSRYK